jgi:ribosomal protein L12E/L44/L45/RPP1/RPP2
MEEGGVDEFAQPPTNEATAAAAVVEPDIKCVGEIVSSVFHAKETISPSERQVCDKAFYGDLPEERWHERPEQERRWMAPKADDALFDLQSMALPHPDRTIVIGTNGVLSFALQCADSASVPVSGGGAKEKTAAAAKMAAEKKMSQDALLELRYSEYEKQNVAFAYKRELAQVERHAFYQTTRYEIATTHIRGDAEYLKKRLVDTGKIDASLRPIIAKLEPKLVKRIEKLPPKFAAGVTRPDLKKTAVRPGGAHAAVSIMTCAFLEQEPALLPASDATDFRLLVCKTPTDCVPEAGKDKRTKWIDVNLSFATASKTVPAASFNDTHLAIVYLPKSTLPGTLFLDLFPLPLASVPLRQGKIKFEREKRFCFNLPPQFCESGLISLHLSSAGIASLAYGNGVLVFDTQGMVEGMRAIFLDGKEHPRCITSCAVYHPPNIPRPAAAAAPLAAAEEKEKGKEEETEEEETRKKQEEVKNYLWAGSILFGTDKGECYAVDWRTGFVHYIEATPAVEPIFYVHYSNGKMMMQTISSVCGTISNISDLDRTTILQVDRAVGMDTCGALVYIMSKYGFIKIMSSLARGVARHIPPPKLSLNTPILQHAYRGVKAFPERVVCIYPNGVVRNLILSGAQTTK